MNVVELHPAPRPPTSKTAAHARRVALAFRALAIVLPASVAWVAATATPEHVRAALGVPSAPPLAGVVRVALVALALLPVGASAVALEQLRRCALAVGAGRGLTVEAARCLCRAASLMLAASVLALVTPTALGALVSWASGRTTVVVHVGPGVALPLVMSLSFRLLGGLVLDGARLAREHAEIV